MIITVCLCCEVG